MYALNNMRNKKHKLKATIALLHLLIYSLFNNESNYYQQHASLPNFGFSLAREVPTKTHSDC